MDQLHNNMLSPVVLILVTLVGAAAALLVLFLRQSRCSSSRLPPTPPGWPLIGHLFLLLDIMLTGKPVDNLRHQYGPIVTLRLGPFYYIFITGAEIAHEALVQKGSLFASRPLLPSIALFTSNFRTISAAPYGAYWRNMRRNLVSELLNPGKVKVFKPARNRIIQTLIDRLKAEAQRSDGIVAVHSNCRKSMFELLLLIGLGVYFNYDENQDVRELDELLTLFMTEYTSLVGDIFPFLSFLDWRKTQMRKKIWSRQIRTFDNLMQHRQKAELVGEVVPGNYVETLHKLQREGELTISTDGQIAALCAELLWAGTDTTVSCVEWTMANLVMNPGIQAKVHEEIEKVVGKGKAMEEEDVERMPYLQAVIKESLRKHPPAHTLIPHSVTEACKVGGYEIPAGALVDCHLPSISRSQEIWEEAGEFKPERFIAREVDMTGTKEVTMIPFSAGRRMCPGANMALMHVALFLGRLVQAFQWGPNSEAPLHVDMTEKLSFNVVMKTPLTVPILPRC